MGQQRGRRGRVGGWYHVSFMPFNTLLAYFRASLGANDFCLVFNHLLTFSPLFGSPWQKKGLNAELKFCHGIG